MEKTDDKVGQERRKDDQYQPLVLQEPLVSEQQAPGKTKLEEQQPPQGHTSHPKGI